MIVGAGAGAGATTVEVAVEAGAGVMKVEKGGHEVEVIEEEGIQGVERGVGVRGVNSVGTREGGEESLETETWQQSRDLHNRIPSRRTQPDRSMNQRQTRPEPPPQDRHMSTRGMALEDTSSLNISQIRLYRGRRTS